MTIRMLTVLMLLLLSLAFSVHAAAAEEHADIKTCKEWCSLERLESNHANICNCLASMESGLFDEYCKGAKAAAAAATPFNQDDSTGGKLTSKEMSILNVSPDSDDDVQGVTTTNNPPVVEKRCVSIKSTSACAPWSSHGLEINVNALAEVYGVEISNASQWEAAILDATSGGDLMQKQWVDFAGCPGYANQPIHFLRTYSCLTDIFFFSSECNAGKKIPGKGLCDSMCSIYADAVDSLLKDEDVCTSDQQLKDNGELEIISHRNALRDARRTCVQFLTDLNPPIQDSESSSLQSFSNNGFAKDYVKGSQECSPGTSLGVSDDETSCGFSGNINVAQLYCEDFDNAPPCCQSIASSSSDTSALAAAAELSAAENASSSSAASSAGIGFGSIFLVGGVALVAVAAAVASVLVVFRRRRRRSKGMHSPVDNGKSVVLGMTASVASAPRAASIDAARYVAIHEYAKSLPDELELRRGDTVTVTSQYDDGWCLAKNMTTGNSGTCPLACLKRANV